MKRFKNILFIPCGAAANRLALRQALQLTRENNAQLRILMVAHHIPEGWEFATVVERHMREQVAEDLAAVIAEAGLAIDPAAIPVAYVTGEPFLEIIRAVVRDEHDLIIKAADEPVADREHGFTTTDMHLLRKCPCPLWLFRPNKNPEDQLRLMAAIDPNPDNPANPELTRTILQLGTSLRERLVGSHLDVMYAWQYEYESALRNSPFLKVPQAQLDQEIERARKLRAEDFNEALDEFQPSDAAITPRLEKGNPIEVVPKAVRETPIDLLIMGTLARGGIAGLLIGNTAESMLNRVDCSVMAIKPEGFNTPVTL